MSEADDDKKKSANSSEYKYFGDDTTAGYNFGLNQSSDPAMNTNLPDWFKSATTPGAASTYAANVPGSVPVPAPSSPGSVSAPAPGPAAFSYTPPPPLPELHDLPALADLKPLIDLPDLPDLQALPDLPDLVGYKAPPPLPESVAYKMPPPLAQSQAYKMPDALPESQAYKMPPPLAESVAYKVPSAPPLPMAAVRRADAGGRPQPLNLGSDSRFSGLSLPAELSVTVERIFALNDLDFNGFVDFSEITKMLEGDELTASEKQFVQLIYQVGKKIVAERGVVDDTCVPVMSKDDFKLAFASVLKNVMPGLAATQPSPVIGAGPSIAGGLPQPVGQSFRPQVYAEDDYPLGSIKTQAVKMGTMGDAYFAACLVSLIDLHPRSIMRMINTAADQSFAIAFPGLHGKALDLLPPRADEIVHYGLAPKYGFWYPLMEKAYGMYVAQHHKLASSMEHGKDPLPRVSQAIEALTNAPTGMVVVADYTPDAVRQYMLDILSKGKIMVALSTDGISQAAVVAGTAPLPLKPYAVQGYDQNTQKMIVRGVGTVNISDLDESVLRLSVEQFTHYFKAVFYEKDIEQHGPGFDQHATEAASKTTSAINHWRKLPGE